ncbi:MAG: ATP-binding protein [Bacteroidales bacterium]|nr:ATP-binding protein [Bacteroidales bacterium]
MTKNENNVIEFKSLKKITSGDAGFRDLAVTCVCLANTQGGKIVIGIDDKTKVPPQEQVVTDEIINNSINRLRSLCFNVGIVAGDIETHENGGQFFSIIIQPSLKSIATTSDGKIYLRIGDQCQAARRRRI